MVNEKFEIEDDYIELIREAIGGYFCSCSNGILNQVATTSIIIMTTTTTTTTTTTIILIINK